MTPSEPADPGSLTPPNGGVEPPIAVETAAGRSPSPSSSPEPGPAARPGAGTFTIEGRQAPALFVIGWLATIVGIAMIGIALLSGGGGAAPWLLLGGLIVLSVGLVAGAGSQAVERRTRGGAVYLGPSPFLVFAASIPTSLVAVIAVGVPLSLADVAVDGPIGRLLAVVVQALIYVGLIRLLVVDPGALSWSAMGIRRPSTGWLRELVAGAAWAAPVIVVTIPIAAILGSIFPVQPVSPLPPTGETAGFVVNLLAGAVVAPIGEEIMFRGFATTAWTADLGARRGLVQAAMFFALAHVLTIGGGTAGEALGLAVLGFATRLPVALALGWLFLRRGTIWAPIGLHATFNAILLILGEAAFRAGT